MKTFSEKLAGAVIGLVRGCDGNMDLVTADTEKIITEGIITAFYGSDEEISSYIKKVQDEKYRIVPDCAVCKNPCGRTFDYNFKDLSLDGEDVACLKMLLLNSVVGYLMILKEKAGNSGIEKSDFAPSSRGTSVVLTSVVSISRLDELRRLTRAPIRRRMSIS